MHFYEFGPFSRMRLIASHNSVPPIAINGVPTMKAVSNMPEE